MDLTKGDIPSQLRHLFIPASVGFFFHVLFNIVDTFYGGQISPEALAALAITFPIYFIILSLGVGFSAGISALIATDIGAKQPENARAAYLQGIGFMLLLSIATAFFGHATTLPLLRAMGAPESLIEPSLLYILLLYDFSIPMIMVHVVNAGLSAMGRNQPNRNFLIISFFANIVLNYWFIYGGLGLPAMGIRGIAIATIVIHIFGIGYLLRHIGKTHLFQKPRLAELIPRREMVAKIIKQGVPTTFNMLSISFYFFVINYFVTHFGEDAIAAYGIGLRIEQLILVPGVGLNIAIATMVAQNHGARQFQRIRDTVRLGFIYSLSIMIGGGAFILVAGEGILTLFTREPEVIRIGLQYLRIEAFTLASYGLMHVSSAILQGLKKPNISSYINLVGRITPIPVLLLLIDHLHAGSSAIWWTILVNSYLMGIVFVWFMRRESARAFGG